MNPRARFCQATRFRGGLFQPLRHLSGENGVMKDYQRASRGTMLRKSPALMNCFAWIGIFGEDFLNGLQQSFAVVRF